MLPLVVPFHTVSKQRTLVLWCFQGVQKESCDIKQVKELGMKNLFSLKTSENPQLAFTCPKSTIGAPEKGVKYVQS